MAEDSGLTLSTNLFVLSGRCEQCEYEAETFRDGQVFTPHSDPCLRCHCEAGNVSCHRLDRNCPPVRCSHPANQAGHCCPSCDMCEYESALIGNGQMFHPAFGGPCIQCTCSNGNVQCEEESCRPLTCNNFFRRPGQCCPSCI
ncbi:kielin/chordin-like protein, partial [Rhincodon typus]|uniref:kielin/chordin-like protein n=1 Tax=Rhincodon typus TaxID=259920 RepID=UPI002030B4F7